MGNTEMLDRGVNYEKHGGLLRILFICPVRCISMEDSRSDHHDLRFVILSCSGKRGSGKGENSVEGEGF